MSDTLLAGYGMISVHTVHAYRPTSHPRGAYSAVYNLGNPPRWWWFIIPVPYCYSTNYDTNNISHITTTKYLRRIVHTFPKAQHTNNQKKKNNQKKAIMVFVLGIILACLSLPLVIYAGERTTGRRIPRPQIFRSLSAPDPYTKQERESSPAPPARRQTMDSPRRADTTRSDTSWRTTSTGETYVREVSLGID